MSHNSNPQPIMQLSNEWFATAQQSDRGLIVVRGRLHLDTARLSGRYGMRIEVQWLIKGDDKGMPTDTEGEVIDNIMNVMSEALERSETAILTAIHTGGQQVLYVFYATDIEAFSTTVHPLLQRLGELPLRIGATPDALWSDYTQMIAHQAMAQE